MSLNLNQPPVTPERFRAWVRAYGPILHGYIRKKGALATHEADDLLQRTYVLAWERRESFQGGSAKAWLFAFAQRLVWGHVKKRSREVSMSPNSMQSLIDSPSQPQPEATDRELTALKGCLQQLAEVERLIVIARHGLVRLKGNTEGIEGPLSYPGIAQEIEVRLGERWTATRVRKRHGIAGEKLRRCVSRNRALHVQTGALNHGRTREAV